MKEKTVTHVALAVLISVFGAGAVNARVPHRAIDLKASSLYGLANLAGEDVECALQATVNVFDDGKSMGDILIRIVDGDSFLYRAVEGQATVVDGTVIEIFLSLLRIGEDGTPTGEIEIARVRASSRIPESVFFEILGAEITAEAPGTITVWQTK